MPTITSLLTLREEVALSTIMTPPSWPQFSKPEMPPPAPTAKSPSPGNLEMRHRDKDNICVEVLEVYVYIIGGDKSKSHKKRLFKESEIKSIAKGSDIWKITRSRHLRRSRDERPGKPRWKRGRKGCLHTFSSNDGKLYPGVDGLAGRSPVFLQVPVYFHWTSGLLSLAVRQYQRPSIKTQTPPPQAWKHLTGHLSSLQVINHFELSSHALPKIEIRKIPFPAPFAAGAKAWT